MITFIINLLLYVSCTLMIVLVLLQPHKSEGVMSSSDSNIFGVSVDGGPIAKATAYLAAIIAFLILSLNYLS